MKIARVAATALNVPLHITVAGLDRWSSLEACFVEVETDEGVVGHGLAAITRETVIAEIVNRVIAPALKGDDALDHERIWEKLYWILAPRGQTGFGLQALSAIDIALWDLKGKAFGEPVWRLLGGARQHVPLYATFGFNFFDREQLAAAAKLWVAQGYLSPPTWSAPTTGGDRHDAVDRALSVADSSCAVHGRQPRAREQPAHEQR